MRLGHHAACCLGFDTDNPWLLISGGRIKHDLPPKDIWILNLATSTWKEVIIIFNNSWTRVSIISVVLKFKALASNSVYTTTW